MPFDIDNGALYKGRVASGRKEGAMAQDKPIICFAVVLSVAFFVRASAATLNIPGDFATIQACIDAAQDGDECVVAPETYHELIDFLGKAITLRSSGGPAVTISDAGPVADPGTGKPVVRCDSGEGPDTVLEGFTITGGTGDTATFLGSYIGGGMFNLASSPTVTNCNFIQNTATRGGGMYNTSASPTLTDCTFNGNMGGGMFNIGGSPTVINCMFIGNESGACGGGMCNEGSRPTVLKSTFILNTSGVVGGGMANESGSSPTVTSCRFMANTAQAWGGGMLNNGGSAMVTNCTFIGNTASVGGGMYNSHTPTVVNCTFSGNKAYIVGGGMHNHNSGATVSNCILWDNSPVDIPDSDIFLTPTFSFSVVQGGLPVGATDAGGNIGADPMFVRNPNAGLDGMWGTEDDDFGDLRLLAGSPSINAGDPASFPGPTATDLDGHTRVLCMRIDMGAYEFGIGDFDCDQIVTLTDFADWADCMTEPGAQSISLGCDAFDFEFDGDIDLIDWAGFQNAFTGP